LPFESLEEIVTYAIEREKEAQAFYREVSQEATTAGAKEMFVSFARQEEKHQEMLEKLLAGDTDQNIRDYELKWIPDMKRSNYVVDMTYRKGMDYRDILLLAMKREEKALALYNDLLRRSEAEDHKRVFMILCQEEAKHKLSLEALYDDYMAEMGD